MTDHMIPDTTPGGLFLAYLLAMPFVILAVGPGLDWLLDTLRRRLHGK